MKNLTLTVKLGLKKVNSEERMLKSRRRLPFWLVVSFKKQKGSGA
ncbi:hypothetical protein Cabys_3609 [Caldithrix abyssi DSM 13497]|uniref:Uncharacterized protein n=1 Tax=Caldithrix abyssi DSM 13497 TaxID=880073 RepID=A0A1J1CCB7_CALAY|nr:hypothetical protein Cabys_3609 [Caldithrix abyssi DSM 13497]